MQPVFVTPKPTKECVPVEISCDTGSNSVSRYYYYHYDYYYYYHHLAHYVG